MTRSSDRLMDEQDTTTIICTTEANINSWKLKSNSLEDHIAISLEDQANESSTHAISGRKAWKKKRRPNIVKDVEFLL